MRCKLDVLFNDVRRCTLVSSYVSGQLWRLVGHNKNYSDLPQPFRGEHNGCPLGRITGRGSGPDRLEAKYIDRY